MRQTRKSSLFLIELIIAILFFSLSSAVCVTLFSASYRNTKESEYRNVAILEAQSMVELFRNDAGQMATVLEVTDAKEVAQGEYMYYLDESGSYISLTDTDETEVEVYEVVLITSGEGNMPALDIYIIPPNSQETIVELSTQIYVAQESEGQADE